LAKGLNRFDAERMSSPENRDPVVIGIHSACTCNQSPWIGKDVAPPAAERRRRIGFRDFAIVLKALRINPNTG